MDDNRVVFDGSLLDRVAEFSFMKKSQIQELYSNDESGYNDAITKFTHILSTNMIIVGAEHPAFNEQTNKLKEGLKRYSKFEISTFFRPDQEELHRRACLNWLSANWNHICNELENQNSNTYIAILGYLKREFVYYWMKIDPNWTHPWYLDKEDIFKLPEKIMKTLLDELVSFTIKMEQSIEKNELMAWINLTLSTHFYIFARYLIFCGNDTGHQYIPSFTRSSLSFLLQPEQTSEINKLVIPYIGLQAIKRVKNRSDLIDVMIDWCNGPGNEIVKNLNELHVEFRKKNVKMQNEIIDAIEKILTSKQSKPLYTIINMIKLAASAALEKKLDTDTINALHETLKSKNYSWLWSIRSPELEYEMKKHISNLLIK